MVKNILVTGGAGYIGGSIVAELMSRTSGLIKATIIVAAVRSEEQVQSLSKAGVRTVRVNLTDEAAVKETILRNEIDLVVHIASSSDARIPSYLIQALGQRYKASGEATYFIHSGVTTLFTAEAGWPYGEVRDTDPVFEKEKEMGGSHPVRETDIAVVEQAQLHGVTSFNVVVPQVYGRGTGAWRKLSVSIPAHVRASIKHKAVYKFDKEGIPPAVHISDLTALYALLVDKILQNEPIPSGKEGYYFATAHRASWWDVLQGLANGLYARGLVGEPELRIWPSDRTAAERLEFPVPYVRAMCTSSGDIVAENAYRLGWQPKWDEKRYLESMDDEIQAVQELDTVKPTIFASLINPSDQ
ncbi:uncharacterized protein Z518_07826 [Rhinocladiella mackenziei CBS 650.93]|uniref:NAD-dependent epimerase/dehydratase domain-containing protein n=1 Tax=Rhinocladiella mackenziei CBS 650.93 TaxID=1442369 RepID=A0A0D2FIP1_9EURO|nr:uncharacterized protein Z518_07826 [Rhinocladiella mackenziei CBS 650.93]KIX01887.1 hypothetical protein Z518_07826 [Rhinocladiella mackenziei CBS 650.93]